MILKGKILMKLISAQLPIRTLALLTIVALSASTVTAQTCQTSGDLDDSTRSSLTAAAQRAFGLAMKGDVVSLRQSAIPSLAADFSAVETRVNDHQSDLAAAQASVKSIFLLQTEGSAPSPHAEFYCGVFGKTGQTATSAVFYLNNLPPGNYGVVLLEVTSPKGKLSFSPVLQQQGSDWKLGDLYIKSSQVASHDSDWFLSQARQYKAKGQMHNAWFFYAQARNIISPLPFMSTAATDKLYDESRGAQPGDLPADGKTVDLPAGSATYKLMAVFPEAVGNDLDLIVRYQVADASNGNQAYQTNVAVIKALVAKYPELRDAFVAVVGRAVDAAGHDYGTLLAMKDIK